MKPIWTSQDGKNLSGVQLDVVKLCDEHSSYRLKECCPVHVDRGTYGQDEAADVLVHSIVFLHALHHRWQRGGAVHIC